MSGFADVYKVVHDMCGHNAVCKLDVQAIADNTGLEYNEVYRILSKHNQKLWDISQQNNVTYLHLRAIGKGE